MYRTTAAILLMTAALAGCDDDKDGVGPTPVEASFELAVTGALTETASGRAFFGSDTDDDGNPVFAVTLGEDTSRHLLVAVKRGATRPAEGTYALTTSEEDENGFGLLHIISDGDELLGMFVAETGTITITESSGDVLEGTFAFEAGGFFGDDADEIEAEGSFVAVPAVTLMAVTAERRIR